MAQSDDARGPAALDPIAFADGDAGIVRYLLTLEYLEAAFYREAADRRALDVGIPDFAENVLWDEQQHAQALEGELRRLGSAPPPRPRARFAFDAPGGARVLGARLEHLRAAASLGQVGRARDPRLVPVLLAIHSTEARHAATLGHFAGTSPTPDGALGVPLAMADVLRAVAPFVVAQGPAASRATR